MLKLLTNWRVALLLVALVLSVFSIAPSDRDGVAVRFVEKGSVAFEAGFSPPEKSTKLSDLEIITHVNGVVISNMEEYYTALGQPQPDETIRIRSNKDQYTFKVREYVDNETNESVTENIGLTVFDAPKTNLKKGLDLQGGVRVLLQPEEEVTEDVLDRVVESLNQRLNAFGLNDVVIRKSGDLNGNRFVLVEIAGMQSEEIQDLLGSQGKFEAVIDDTVVFTGGDDIVSICRTADCSGIDVHSGCGGHAEGYACRFFFTIGLSSEAAQRQADATRDLTVVTDGGQQYLSSDVVLNLDGEEVDRLAIGAGLRGRAEKIIQISGVGTGATREIAITDALDNMKKMQAILETGSLPVKLQIVKADNLSPALGREFLQTALTAGLIALLAVSAVIFVRYRKFKVVLSTLFVNISEVVLLLGVAAMFGTNLDLAAIAGIIIVVGTGVDHQIVIADEMTKGELKRGVKNAFFIIMAAFFTTLVAMVPLVFAGAGMLKGFALTTIFGLLIGVFITRPAYAAILEKVL